MRIGRVEAAVAGEVGGSPTVEYKKLTASSNMRCVIVGEGSLPIICGEILMDRGHSIIAIASPDPDVEQWGRSHGIVHTAGPSALRSALGGGSSFDFLFSITNFQKLPGDLIDAARKCPVNYHDSPLPRYAGSHATSWALLNGETSHAITWHVMTARIDGGDILCQVPVPIDAGDTALTLNAKCFEAAIDGFRSLLDDIEADALDPRPQAGAERSFYRRNQRPPGGCSLDFDKRAERLSGLVRALEFGGYPNPLGMPKLALGESFVIVTALEVLDRVSTDPAGTVVEVTANRIVVATATRDVALGAFMTIDGAPLASGELLDRGALRPGQRFPPLTQERAARLDALCSELARNEAFWMAQLAAARPTALPGALREARPPRRPTGCATAVAVEVRPYEIASCRDGAQRLLVAFLAYLAELLDAESVDIALSCMRPCCDPGDLSGFVSGHVPLRVRIGPGETRRQLHSLAVQVDEIHGRRSYVRDAPARAPSLNSRLAGFDPSGWPIHVQLLDDSGAAPTAPPVRGRMLLVRIANDGNACTFAFDPDAVDGLGIEWMARGFSDFVAALAARADPVAPELCAESASALERGRLTT